jgi:hypothetical protein
LRSNCSHLALSCFPTSPEEAWMWVDTKKSTWGRPSWLVVKTKTCTVSLSISKQQRLYSWASLAEVPSSCPVSRGQNCPCFQPWDISRSLILCLFSHLAEQGHDNLTML